MPVKVLSRLLMPEEEKPGFEGFKPVLKGFTSRF